MHLKQLHVADEMWRADKMLFSFKVGLFSAGMGGLVVCLGPAQSVGPADVDPFVKIAYPIILFGFWKGL